MAFERAGVKNSLVVASDGTLTERRHGFLSEKAGSDIHAEESLV